MTLKEVEPAIEKKFQGPKGTVEGGNLAAARELLHERAYSKAELEEAVGSKLEDLFAGNASQLKSVAFADKNGEILQDPSLSGNTFSPARAANASSF